MWTFQAVSFLGISWYWDFITTSVVSHNLGYCSCIELWERAGIVTQHVGTACVLTFVAFNFVVSQPLLSIKLPCKYVSQQYMGLPHRDISRHYHTMWARCTIAPHDTLKVSHTDIYYQNIKSTKLSHQFCCKQT